MGLCNPYKHHYRKQARCQEPASLPRAKCRALGKERFAESRPSATVGRRQNHICRGPGRRQRIPLGNRALCRGSGRRQRKAVGKSLSLPRSGSRQNMAVGKPVTAGKTAFTCRLFCRGSEFGPRQRITLPSVVSVPSAKYFFFCFFCFQIFSLGLLLYLKVHIKIWSFFYFISYI